MKGFGISPEVPAVVFGPTGDFGLVSSDGFGRYLTRNRPFQWETQASNCLGIYLVKRRTNPLNPDADAEWEYLGGYTCCWLQDLPEGLKVHVFTRSRDSDHCFWMNTIPRAFDSEQNALEALAVELVKRFEDLPSEVRKLLGQALDG